MELAERIEEKRPSVVKSDTIESSFTANSKPQQGSNIRAFVVLTAVGLFILLGGTVLVSYQNFMDVNEEASDDQIQATQENGRKLISDRNRTANSNYHKILLIVAFTLIGVGATCVAIGSVGTVTCFVRYRLSSEPERSPILEKSSEFDPISTKKVYSKRRKSKKRTASWMKNTTRSFSREGFRFAAHRHPSVNPISIDGSRFMFRRLSEHSTSSSDENMDKMNGSPTKSRIGDFLRRMFCSNISSKLKEDKLEMENDRDDRPDDFSLHENNFTFLSTAVDDSRLCRDAGGESETTSGLYNLEQE